MKDKQEQIEEMAQAICGAKDSDVCQNGCSKACGDWKYAERAYSAGYRKASDVIDEFVKRVKETALNVCKDVDCYERKRIETNIENIAGEMEREFQEAEK